LLLIAVDARQMSGAMTKCEKGDGADAGRNARPMSREMVTNRESGMERGGARRRLERDTTEWRPSAVGGDGAWKDLHDDARMVEVVEKVAEQVAHLEAVL
jgi:hypothetical protein